jgi:hypothetical protein
MMRDHRFGHSRCEATADHYRERRHTRILQQPRRGAELGVEQEDGETVVGDPFE